MTYELVVIGASWGGFDALRRLLERVPEEVDLPIAHPVGVGKQVHVGVSAGMLAD